MNSHKITIANTVCPGNILMALAANLKPSEKIAPIIIKTIIKAALNPNAIKMLFDLVPKKVIINCGMNSYRPDSQRPILLPNQIAH